MQFVASDMQFGDERGCVILSDIKQSPARLTLHLSKYDTFSSHVRKLNKKLSYR